LVNSGGEDRLLEQYLRVYLWPDDEWLRVEGPSATYWQARLAQTTTVDLLPDGRAKWRVRTRIVEEITNADEAVQLCLALNLSFATFMGPFELSFATVMGPPGCQ